MIAETTNDISVATVTATSESSPQPPRALAEAAFWATHFWRTWWLLPILTQVVVPSARAGTYCIADILLVLLAHACGERARLRETLRDFAPFAGALMALWGRDRMPGQSTISRWLGHVDGAAVTAFRTLFCPTSVWRACGATGSAA
jgi:hypothetical protein